MVLPVQIHSLPGNVQGQHGPACSAGRGNDRAALQGAHRLDGDEFGVAGADAHAVKNASYCHAFQISFACCVWPKSPC